MKGVLTKMKNKEIKEETNKIKTNDNLTYEEKNQQIGEIGNKYNVDLSSIINSSTS